MKILSGLAEGQVLQRLGRSGASCRIAGLCSAVGPLQATVSASDGILKGWNRRVVGKADGKGFRAKIEKIPAGGPYRMELRCESHKRVIAAFYVGDVWLLAGQSNMQGTGDMEGAARPHPLIRAFSMRHVWRLATDPLHILAESPDACHNEGLQCSEEQGEARRRTEVKGTGVGIFFAREMLQRTGVPQGLIPTAHGATSLAQWSPKAKAGFYESMVRSVRATGQPVAGVLWHQGEGDAKPETVNFYTRGMKELVAAVRRNLRQPGLPWIMGQLARSFEPGRNAASWNAIQEQQRLLPGKIDRLETVSTVDLPQDDAIHLGAAAFPRLAMRMAAAAEHLVLKSTRRRQPGLRSVVPPGLPVDSKGRACRRPFVEVIFDHIEGGLQAPGEPCGFALLDASGQPLAHLYKTTLHKNRVRLHADWESLRKMTPRLAYGHGVTPVCNITDARQCALPVFAPVPIFQAAAYLPFLTEWEVTGLVTSGKTLQEVCWREIAALPTVPKKYPDGFVNEHSAWCGKRGQQYFSTQIELPEPMRLQFLMGYDGPFRLWLNETPFFTDLQGTNPCPPDKSAKTAFLPAGGHRITVGMDLHCGQAWGFLLRFRRLESRRGARVARKKI